MRKNLYRGLENARLVVCQQLLRYLEETPDESALNMKIMSNRSAGKLDGFISLCVTAVTIS